MDNKLLSIKIGKVKRVLTGLRKTLIRKISYNRCGEDLLKISQVLQELCTIITKLNTMKKNVDTIKLHHEFMIKYDMTGCNSKIVNLIKKWNDDYVERNKYLDTIQSNKIEEFNSIINIDVAGSGSTTDAM